MLKALKEILAFILELIKISLVALVIVVPIRMFIFQPFIVKGASMEPNYRSGDYLIIDELTYRFREPKRGEVIVFRFPNNPSQFYIKRIIGLPGERIEIKKGKIFIYPKDGLPFELDERDYLEESSKILREVKVELKADEYFVLGDNREFSSDSRVWGPVPKKYIIGRVLIRLWPPPFLPKLYFKVI